jgi:hypothetical protein
MTVYRIGHDGSFFLSRSGGSSSVWTCRRGRPRLLPLRRTGAIAPAVVIGRPWARGRTDLPDGGKKQEWYHLGCSGSRKPVLREPTQCR